MWERAHPTFQSDDCGAVEVQQGGQGTAVGVVLQQVLHQGERGRAPLLSLLFPTASLKPWQRQRYAYMCHRGGHVQCDCLRLFNAHAWVRSHSPRITLHKQVLIKTSEGFGVALNNAELKTYLVFICRSMQLLLLHNNHFTNSRNQQCNRKGAI